MRSLCSSNESLKLFLVTVLFCVDKEFNVYTRPPRWHDYGSARR
jgi:hypothetical protein